MTAFPHRNWRDAGIKGGLPNCPIKLDDLVAQLQEAYKLTSKGKFPDAIEMMRRIILLATLTVVDTKARIQEAQELIRICKNYIVALSMELSRKELPKVTFLNFLKIFKKKIRVRKRQSDRPRWQPT